jgi:hypothetical protein
MLDELDRRYPEPDWLMRSSDGHLHSQDGITFMRHRSASGKRKIHTEACAMERPASCSCDFTDVGHREPLGNWI